MDEAGQLVAVAVAVVDGHQIGQRCAGAPARGVVAEAHGVAALRDAGEPVGIVIAIGDRGLPYNLHLAAPPGGVVLVVHGSGARAQRGHLLGRGVEADIVLPGDGAGDGIGDPGQARKIGIQSSKIGRMWSCKTCHHAF